MIFNNLVFWGGAHDFFHWTNGVCGLGFRHREQQIRVLPVKVCALVMSFLGVGLIYLGSGVPVSAECFPMVCSEDILELRMPIVHYPDFPRPEIFHRNSIYVDDLSVFIGNEGFGTRTSSRWNDSPTLSVQMLRIAHVFGFHVLRENLYRECNAQVSYGGTPDVGEIENRIAEVFPILRIRVVGGSESKRSTHRHCEKTRLSLSRCGRLKHGASSGIVSVLLPRLQL